VDCCVRHELVEALMFAVQKRSQGNQKLDASYRISKTLKNMRRT